MQGLRTMRALLDGIGETYRNLRFLENLFEFLALEPTVTDPVHPAAPAAVAREVRLERVTFRYPGSRRDALKDFSLTLPAGEITALVGANGAGKSTVVKLIARLYDPEAGRITVDGVDIRSMALDLLRRRITVLFQEPVHYHDTVANNIAFGDLESAPTAPHIESAARGAGADAPIARLPEGYGTVLGKWFGGAELSVGEWQRIALARAFLRRASLVILDEPTSAMDSWAEADWMSRFRDLVAGSTALIITHRFTTALRADVIHVMEDGRIVESGSHAELVALGGRYARSWHEQVQTGESFSLG
jgi:ATP-binding cassette subfamily B protein